MKDFNEGMNKLIVKIDGKAEMILPRVDKET